MAVRMGMDYRGVPVLVGVILRWLPGSLWLTVLMAMRLLRVGRRCMGVANIIVGMGFVTILMRLLGVAVTPAV
jgi:hypothetical protein